MLLNNVLFYAHTSYVICQFCTGSYTNVAHINNDFNKYST